MRSRFSDHLPISSIFQEKCLGKLYFSALYWVHLPQYSNYLKVCFLGSSKPWAYRPQEETFTILLAHTYPHNLELMYTFSQYF
jgi:hypothetical protein